MSLFPATATPPSPRDQERIKKCVDALLFQNFDSFILLIRSPGLASLADPVTITHLQNLPLSIVLEMLLSAVSQSIDLQSASRSDYSDAAKTLFVNFLLDLDKTFKNFFQNYDKLGKNNKLYDSSPISPASPPSTDIP